MLRRLGILGILVACSPLVFLYFYLHRTHSETSHLLRKDIHFDFLHEDSASYWAKVVKFNKRRTPTTPSKSHYEYVFQLKNKSYRGVLYQAELEVANATVGLNDSIRIVYSKSDPHLNVPHMILNDID